MPKPQVEANAFFVYTKMTNYKSVPNYSYGTEAEVVTTQDPPADLSASALKAKD